MSVTPNRRRKTDTLAIVLQSLTALAAVAALVIVVIVAVNRVDNFQAARRDSAYDTCKLLRYVIFGGPYDSATLHHKRIAFMKTTALGNCFVYSHTIIKGG